MSTPTSSDLPRKFAPADGATSRVTGTMVSDTMPPAGSGSGRPGAGSAGVISAEPLGPPSHAPARWLGGPSAWPRAQIDVHFSEEGSVATVRIWGEFDLAAEQLIEAELHATFAARVDHIVIDLRMLAFMDLTGVRVLENAYARSRQDDVELSIVNNPVDSIARLLHLTRMDEVLPLVDEPPRL